MRESIAHDVRDVFRELSTQYVQSESSKYLQFRINTEESHLDSEYKAYGDSIVHEDGSTRGGWHHIMYLCGFSFVYKRNHPIYCGTSLFPEMLQWRFLIDEAGRDSVEKVALDIMDKLETSLKKHSHAVWIDEYEGMN